MRLSEVVSARTAQSIFCGGRPQSSDDIVALECLSHTASSALRTHPPPARRCSARVAQLHSLLLRVGAAPRTAYRAVPCHAGEWGAVAMSGRCHPPRSL